MANILFYVPFNQRSRDTESVMLAFRKQGHTVICLSQLEGYLINDFLNAHGITAVSHVIKGPRTAAKWGLVAIEAQFHELRGRAP